MIVEVCDSLSTLQGEYRTALRFPAQTDFFLSLDWFEILLETALPESVSPRIYIASEEDRRAGIALFCMVDEKTRTLQSLSNYYSLNYAPVSFGDPNSWRHGLSRIAEEIAAELPRWATVDLALMEESRPENEALAEALADSGFSVLKHRMYENWFLHTEGSDFDTYYSSRSSRLRNTIKRKEKKIRNSGELELVVHTEPGEDLERAIVDYVAVYNLSWKKPEPHTAFIPTFARRCAELGILRLGIATIDGNPVAAQFWITNAGRAIIYKLAYDEQFKALSVGSILSRELFRMAIDDDQVREIDYGVGGEAYKRDWMSSVRHLERLEAFNKRSARGLIGAANQSARNAAKKLIGRR